MKRRTVLTFFVLFALALAFPGIPEAQFDEGDGLYYGKYQRLRVDDFKSVELRSFLKDKRGKAADAVLLRLEAALFYSNYGKESADRKISVNLSFGLSNILGFNPDDFGNMRLIEVTDGGEKKVIAKNGVLEIDSSSAIVKVVFKEWFDIGLQKKILLFVADLYNLEEGDQFKAIFDYEKDLRYKPPSGGEDEPELYTGGLAMADHYVGNRPPVLSFWGDGKVSSEYKNMDGTEFGFWVYYQDENNDPPGEKFLEIDEKGNGEFKRYEMKEADVVRDDFNWTQRRRFGVKISLGYTGKPVRFRHFFSDGRDEAVGEASQEQSVMIIPWAFVPDGVTSLSPGRVLPGQRVRIQTFVIKHLDARVDWPKTGSFNGFQIEKVLVGKPFVFQQMQEFEVQPLTISLIPRGADFGVLEIDFLKFGLKVKKVISATGEISVEKFVNLPSVKIEIAPIMAEAKLSRGEATLGDEVGYLLKVRFYEGAKKKTDFMRMSFAPFIRLDSSPEIKRIQSGKIIEETYKFRMWIYSLPLGGDSHYSFPARSVSVTFGTEEKNYTVEIPGEKIRFAPPLSKEELEGRISTSVTEARGLNAKGIDLFLEKSRMAGIILLATILMAVLILLFSGRQKRKMSGERKKQFLSAYKNCLGQLMKNPLRSREGAGILFVSVQDFWGQFSADEKTNPRSRTFRNLKGLAAESKDFNAQERDLWLELLSGLEELIFSDDFSEEESERTRKACSNLVILLEGKRRRRKLLRRAI